MSSQTALTREDADIIVRMLYYCTSERNSSQIKSYCRIDGSQFERYTSHCIRHRLLRKFLSKDGSDDFGYIVTDQGRKTLETAQEIMNALGLSINLTEGDEIANYS